VDALRRQIFRTLFSENWPHGVEPAVDAALLGRYYERFAHDAVAIARQVSYLVTGPDPRTMMWAATAHCHRGKTNRPRCISPDNGRPSCHPIDRDECPSGLLSVRLRLESLWQRTVNPSADAFQGSNP
jgi:hypothetical protein